MSAWSGSLVVQLIMAVERIADSLDIIVQAIVNEEEE